MNEVRRDFIYYFYFAIAEESRTVELAPESDTFSIEGDYGNTETADRLFK